MDGAEWKSNDLHSMLRICTLLQSVRALYAARTSSAVRAILEKHLLLLILELIPADRGAIILEGARSGDFEIEAHWLEQVMSECGPVTGQSAGRQVLLAPLIVRSEVAGVIYLDSFDAASLGEPQALLLAAIAEIASLATADRESIAALITAMKRRPIRYALLDLDYHTGSCKQVDFDGDTFGIATERQFVAAHRHG